MPDNGAPRIDVGQLRQSVQLQTDLEDPDASDDFGNPVRGWTTVATLRARVENLSGRELLLARQNWPTVSYRVTLRACVPIDGTQRLVYAGRELSILSALPLDERPRWLVILATEFRDPSQSAGG